jgi:hypothetical protein
VPGAWLVPTDAHMPGLPSYNNFACPHVRKWGRTLMVLPPIMTCFSCGPSLQSSELGSLPPCEPPRNS